MLSPSFCVFSDREWAFFPATACMIFKASQPPARPSTYPPVHPPIHHPTPPHPTPHPSRAGRSTGNQGSAEGRGRLSWPNVPLGHALQRLFRSRGGTDGAATAPSAGPAGIDGGGGGGGWQSRAWEEKARLRKRKNQARTRQDKTRQDREMSKMGKKRGGEEAEEHTIR